MTTVKNISELKEALSNRTEEFTITDKKLLAATILANKICNFKAKDLIPTTLAKNPELREVVITTGVIITITLCVTAVTIVAILKDYNVYLETDPNTGKSKASLKK